MHKQLRIRLSLLLVGLVFLILASQLHHSKVQENYANFDIEKTVISQPKAIKISSRPVKLLHYQQRAIKGKMWSYLTVNSPVEQQVNANSFKLFRGTSNAPNIYFDEDIRVNSKNTRKLKKGINTILMSTEYNSVNDNNQLIIINKRGLHYDQGRLKAKF